MCAESTHFKGKEAIGHVAETQAEGLMTSLEVHGTEAPGQIAAGADAARETAVFLMMIILIFFHSQLPFRSELVLFISCSVGWLIWKVGRSSWLGWQRLERLHRVIAEEKWEIDHHRDQEREELYALYGAKGFEGQLLNDVVEVLMADNDRLLRVMIEEELNLKLEKQVHPLKQGLGALVGGLITTVAVTLAFLLGDREWAIALAIVMMGISGIFSASYNRNRKVPAAVWNMGLGILAFGTAYFTLELVR